jgi:hypothetical protein
MNGGVTVDKEILLYLNDEKIGTINHKFLYDDEANSGREICEGCLLILQDFRYRVHKVEVTNDGYIAHLVQEQS